MQIQKLDTIIVTRGNTLRIELAVTNSNVPLGDYTNIKVAIRYGNSDTAPAIFTGQLGSGVSIDTEDPANEKIIIAVSKTITELWKPGAYFGEIQTVYDGAPYAEAEFVFIIRQNLN